MLHRAGCPYKVRPYWAFALHKEPSSMLFLALRRHWPRCLLNVSVPTQADSTPSIAQSTHCSRPQNNLACTRHLDVLARRRARIPPNRGLVSCEYDALIQRVQVSNRAHHRRAGTPHTRERVVNIRRRGAQRRRTLVSTLLKISYLATATSCSQPSTSYPSPLASLKLYSMTLAQVRYRLASRPPVASQRSRCGSPPRAHPAPHDPDRARYRLRPARGYPPFVPCETCRDRLSEESALPEKVELQEMEPRFASSPPWLA